MRNISNLSPKKTQENDVELQSICKKVKIASGFFSKKDKLKIEQWLFKISEDSFQQNISLAIKKEYANSLLECVNTRNFTAPFDKAPKDGLLQSLQKKLSTSQNKLHKEKEDIFKKFADIFEGKHKRTYTINKSSTSSKDFSINPNGKLRSSTRLEIQPKEIIPKNSIRESFSSKERLEKGKPSKTHKRESSITKRYLEKLKSLSQERKEQVSSPNLKTLLSPPRQKTNSKRFLSMNNETCVEPKIPKRESEFDLLKRIEKFLTKNHSKLCHDSEYFSILSRIRDSTYKNTVTLAEISSLSNINMGKGKMNCTTREFKTAIDKSDTNTNNFLAFLKRIKEGKENN